MLTGASFQLSVDVTEEVSPTGLKGGVSAELTIGQSTYPYDEGFEVALSGQRNNFSIGQSRHNTGWSGQTRSTQGSAQALWTYTNGVMVQSTVSAQISRDWPVRDLPILSGEPAPVYTTEIITMSGGNVVTAGGSATSIPVYTSTYGAHGSTTWSGFNIVVTHDVPQEKTYSVVNGIASYDTNGNVTVTDVRIEGALSWSADDKVVHGVIKFFDGSLLLATRRTAVDPMVEEQETRWQRFKRKARKAARGGARAAAIGLTGATCGISTFLVGTAGAAGTLGTGGAAAPGTVLLTGYMAGKCAYLTAVTWDALAPSSTGN